MTGCDQNLPFLSWIAALGDMSCPGRRALKQLHREALLRGTKAFCQLPLSVCIMLLIFAPDA